MYDIAIRVECAPSKSLIPSASATFSAFAKVALDREAPVEYGQHARPTGSYYPGDDISIAFNEAIASGLTVVGKVSDGTTLSQSDFSFRTRTTLCSSTSRHPCLFWYELI